MVWIALYQKLKSNLVPISNVSIIGFVHLCRFFCISMKNKLDIFFIEGRNEWQAIQFWPEGVSLNGVSRYVDKRAYFDLSIFEQIKLWTSLPPAIGWQCRRRKKKFWIYLWKIWMNWSNSPTKEENQELWYSVHCSL